MPERRAWACSKEGSCWGFSLAPIYFLGFGKEQAFFQSIPFPISFLTFSKAVPVSPIQSLFWIFQGFRVLTLFCLFPRFPKLVPSPFVVAILASTAHAPSERNFPPLLIWGTGAGCSLG